jgi:hypothetical protein
MCVYLCVCECMCFCVQLSSQLFFSTLPNCLSRYQYTYVSISLSLFWCTTTVSLLPSCAPEHLFGDVNYRLALLRLGEAFLLSPRTSQPSSLPFLVAAFRSGLNDCAQECRHLCTRVLRVVMLVVHPRAPPVQRRVDDRELMLQSDRVDHALEWSSPAPVLVHSRQLSSAALRTLASSSTPTAVASACASSSTASPAGVSQVATMLVHAAERDTEQHAVDSAPSPLLPSVFSLPSVQQPPAQAFAGADAVTLGKRVRSPADAQVC